MARNRTYDELAVGDSASFSRVVSANDLVVFAHASGNLNPMHVPELDGDGDGTPEAYAPSMWVGSLFSALLGNRLPGSGTLYRSQTLRFHRRAQIGDTLTATVAVARKLAEGVVAFDCSVVDQAGEVVVEGEAEVFAPTRSIETPEAELPELMVRRYERFERLLAACEPLPALATAVVAPEDEKSLLGALLGRRHGLIEPVLVGARARIEAIAAEHGADLSGLEVVDVPEHGAAAARAIALVHEGRVAAVMKGHLHTHELLAHVAKRDGGLRTTRRISHAFVIDTPGLDSLLMVTDAAINISPSLEDKVDIVQNAIDLALAIGMCEPRVGILSAVETVNPKIPSTLDAAVLAKMAERGQIRGGLVDGPLAMDNAIDVEAARTKGVTSLVAGRAQVLVTPNLESGNMLAKDLAFVAHAETAGLVLGAQVPVMLTSRADDEDSRLASCALAVAYEHWKRTGDAVAVPEEGA